MRKSILAFSIVAALSGCGGGGDSTSGGQPATGAPSTPTTPTPPVVTTDSTVVTVAPAGTYSDADKLAAYTYLNGQRLACGFGALAQSTALDKSAQNHSDYISTNWNVGRTDAFSHVENPAYSGFTGAGAIDRGIYAGYNGINIGEAISMAGTALAQTQAFLNTTYHSLILLSGHHDIGIGLSPTISGSALVVGTGYRTAADYQLLDSKSLATYPCDGQTNVTTTHGAESPNPIPGRDLKTSPAGRAVVATVRDGQTLTVETFTISNRSGAVTAILRTKSTDPNNSIPQNVAVLIPDAPLAAKTTYTAKLIGTNNGQPVNKTWSFTTQ